MSKKVGKQLCLFNVSNLTNNSNHNITQISDNNYLHIEGDIPLELSNNSLISLTRNQPLKIHSLGFQPAKSIPEIPRWFLQKYGKSSFTILEPFAGSGTTIIESIVYGASVYWLDSNPLSRLICEVKTTNFDFNEVNKAKDQLINDLEKITNVPETINFKNKDFWFQKPVQEGLEILRFLIKKINPKLQSIFLLAFSLTVRKTSDMNDGMILAAKRSQVQDIPKRTRNDVFYYFKYYLDKTLLAIFEWQNILNKYTGFTQQLTSNLAQNLSGDWCCDAVISSPPYLNAIDYIWASKFELHWLGLVKNDQDRLNLYSQEIGTERIAKTEYQQLAKTGNKVLDQILEDIYTCKKYQAGKGQNQLRSRVVYKYFIEMKEHFSQVFNHLNSGGYYCFAIGDVNKICGVEIPVASLLTHFASQLGFTKIFQFNLLLKNRKLNLPRNVDFAGTIKHDSIIVLQKNK
jgi:DNA modification methylase